MLERQNIKESAKQQHHQADVSAIAASSSTQRPSSSSPTHSPKKLASLASIRSEKDVNIEEVEGGGAAKTATIKDGSGMTKQESKASSVNSKPGSAKSNASSSSVNNNQKILEAALNMTQEDQSMIIKALDVNLLPIKKWGEEVIQSGKATNRNESFKKNSSLIFTAFTLS